MSPLIPPVGNTPPYQFPQPDRNALHQAHLRSPILRAVDADDRATTNEPAQKYYQTVQSFAGGWYYVEDGYEKLSVDEGLQYLKPQVSAVVSQSGVLDPEMENAINNISSITWRNSPDRLLFP